MSYPAAAAARTASRVVRAVLLLAAFTIIGGVMLIYAWSQAQVGAVVQTWKMAQVRTAASQGGVEDGSTDEERERAVNALKNLSASSQDARDIADRVTMVAVRFERLRNKRIDDAPETLGLPYSVEFDLTRADRAAAVTLADQSVDWRVTPPKISAARASFAIESSALPSPENIPKGALAGFRINNVSHAPIATPLDPWNTERNKANTLCRSLDRWAQYFGIQRTGLSYLFIEDPTRIWFDGRGWSSDGVTVAKLDRDDVAAMCREARAW